MNSLFIILRWLSSYWGKIRHSRLRTLAIVGLIIQRFRLLINIQNMSLDFLRRMTVIPGVTSWWHVVNPDDSQVTIAWQRRHSLRLLSEIDRHRRTPDEWHYRSRSCVESFPTEKKLSQDNRPTATQNILHISRKSRTNHAGWRKFWSWSSDTRS